MGFFNKNISTSVATINDGALILSLTDARDPCVWRMDLTQARLSALELKDDNGATTLQIRTPKGDVHAVATYESRVRALEILTLVAATLSGTKAAPLSAQNESASNGNWLWFGCALTALLILFVFVGAGTKTNSQTRGLTSPSIAGEPLSADDFLNR